MKDNELRTTAIHEAAHVVANIHFGLRFDDVILSDDGGEVSLFEGQRPVNLSEAEPFTIALFAGYAAEHVLQGKDLGIEGEDWERCRLRILPLFRREARFDAFTDKALRASVRFVRSNRDAISLVAETLLSRRRLSEVEVRSLLKTKTNSGE